jgi:prepilin-type N-terminal cleavage/methylation domain-containing protein
MQLPGGVMVINKFLKPAVRDEGFNLIELMIVIFMSALILTAMASIFTTSGNVFQKTKNISDVKEISKGGMAQLEWLFQRWGTATPCNNPDTALCTKVQDCRVNAGYPYPPPGAVCITIMDDAGTEPCDEVQFYANLYGSGFVHTPSVANPAVMNIKSCRLSDASRQNCYHIKAGAKFLSDRQNPAVYTPLIFSLSGLSDNHLDCTDGTVNANATVFATTVALNGMLKDNAGNFLSTYELEGGEIILRVPHRVRLFCRNNSADTNRRWLYMEATDMASDCTAHEPVQPLIPVKSFDIAVQKQGVVVTMEVRGPNGNTIKTQRHFAR